LRVITDYPNVLEEVTATPTEVGVATEVTLTATVAAVDMEVVEEEVTAAALVVIACQTSALVFKSKPGVSLEVEIISKIAKANKIKI
jgi:hypothetical protein